MQEDKRGFSLLELVVVIILMGIMGGILLPNTVMIQKQHVRKLAQEITTDLITQRKRAMSDQESQLYKLILENDGGATYYGYSLDPALEEGGGLTRSENMDNIKTMNITMESATNIPPVTLTEVAFKGRELVDSVGNTITELKITLTLGSTIGNITFNVLTGHYEIKV